MKLVPAGVGDGIMYLACSLRVSSLSSEARWRRWRAIAMRGETRGSTDGSEDDADCEFLPTPALALLRPRLLRAVAGVWF